MKYLKTYEELNIDPKIGNWVVAYRPYKKEYDSISDLVMFNGGDYVIDIGKIKKLHTLNSNSDIKYYTILFRDSAYIRNTTQILYISKNEIDAKNHLDLIKKSVKYNL